jgi:hypothetical protein
LDILKSGAFGKAEGGPAAQPRLSDVRVCFRKMMEEKLPEQYVEDEPLLPRNLVSKMFMSTSAAKFSGRLVIQLLDFIPHRIISYHPPFVDPKPPAGATRSPHKVVKETATIAPRVPPQDER